MGNGLSVVEPVDNSASTQPALIERLESILDGLSRDYEIVLLNDCSDDRSSDEIAAVAQRHAHVRGLDLMRNCGQHNAMLAGIRAARYPITVTLDDDLQNPPEEIPTLLRKLEEGYDVVYGKAIAKRHGVHRGVADRLTVLALRAAIGSDIAGQVSAYRTFRTRLRDAFADGDGPDVSVDVPQSSGWRRVASVPVVQPPRAEGRSGYGFGRLATHALNVLTGFSRPLRTASLIGLAFTLFGLAVLVLVVIRYFVEGNPVPGFPVLGSIIAIFAGVQLPTLGVIGEYIARTHVRIMDRPAYAAREEVGGSGEAT